LVELLGAKKGGGSATSGRVPEKSASPKEEGWEKVEEARAETRKAV